MIKATDDIYIIFLGFCPLDSFPNHFNGSCLLCVEPMTRIELVNLFLTKEALYRLSYMGLHGKSN